MSLISTEKIDAVLKANLLPRQFTTADFKSVFAIQQQAEFSKLIKKYKFGGKGCGSNHSSNTIFGKSLGKAKQRSTQGLSLKTRNHKAPPEWGSHVIALWEYDPQEDIVNDICSILDDNTTTDTEKATLTKSRVGQGSFRDKLIKRWRKCQLTGCENVALLRASHIQPWSACNNKERLDPNNGLLLSANIDALFDKGFISFTDDGELLVSTALSSTDAKLYRVHKPLRIELDKKSITYIQYHRRHVFRCSNSVSGLTSN